MSIETDLRGAALRLAIASDRPEATVEELRATIDRAVVIIDDCATRTAHIEHQAVPPHWLPQRHPDLAELGGGTVVWLPAEAFRRRQAGLAAS
jgi:hypothetical protein